MAFSSDELEFIDHDDNDGENENENAFNLFGEDLINDESRLMKKDKSFHFGGGTREHLFWTVDVNLLLYGNGKQRF